MKTIENKQTSIDNGEPKDTKVDYRFLILACNRQSPQGGYSLQEMKARIRIDDYLQEVKESYDIEDADISKIKEIVKAYKWPDKHSDLVAFVEYIDSL